ncbi:MAG: phosphatidylinositol N-acetylglucosaminyltransferase [Lasallia pustulata]|uniref:Phosphatidylinositol N-acetylglucosaminyltransferase n=1 Tax=Lasallia pustulata TaxID=136370 RepID=A0A5M8PFR0_9LECA|nr:MAG: phosphatidylinositol N-acetylglucosaminyltransferase [Lasallia pustulata]
MFPFPHPTPHLSTHRPSPTTISHTVSTSPPLRTLPLRILSILTLLLRLSFGLCSILLVLAKTRSSHLRNNNYNAEARSLEQLFWARGIGAWSVRTAGPLGWRAVLPLAVGTGFLVLRRFHTEESLLTLSSLGIQTSTSSRTYLSSATTRFIPTSQIRDIVIHEAFRGYEVRFYLAVVVEGEGEVVVVFPNLLPNRKIVEEVWRGARACLYGPKG